MICGRTVYILDRQVSDQRVSSARSRAGTAEVDLLFLEFADRSELGRIGWPLRVVANLRVGSISNPRPVSLGPTLWEQAGWVVHLLVQRTPS